MQICISKITCKICALKVFVKILQPQKLFPKYLYDVCLILNCEALIKVIILHFFNEIVGVVKNEMHNRMSPKYN